MLLTDRSSGSTTALPVSNYQNQQHEVQVIEKQQQLEALQRQIDGVDRQNQLLLERIDHLGREVTQQRALLQAKTNEMHGEESITELMEQELGHLHSENKRLENEIEEYRALQLTNNTKLESQKRHLAELEKRFKFDQSSFQKHLGAVLDADDLNITIQKFMILDEKLFGELNVNIEHMSKALATQQRSLENLALELKVLNTATEKSKGQFNRSQKERHTLLEKFESAVKVLQEKEKEESQLAENISQLQDKKLSTLEANKANAEKLESYERSMADLNRSIGRHTATIGRLRQDCIHAENKKQQSDEQISNSRLLINQVESSKVGVDKQIFQLKEHIEKANVNFKRTKESREKRAMSSLAKLHRNEIELEKAILDAKNTEDSLRRQKDRLLATLTKRRDQIAFHDKETSAMHNDVENSKRMIKALSAKHRSGQQRLSQYEAESELKERELKRLSSRTGSARDIMSSQPTGRVGEEKEDSEEMILMKETLAKTEGSISTFISTIDQSQTEAKQLQRESETQSKHKQQLGTEVKTRKAELEGIERTLANLIKQKDQLSAETNLMVLNLKRLEDMFLGQHAEVMDIANEKDKAEDALKAYRNELKSRKEFLQTQFVALEEERKAQGVKLNECRSKLAQMKNKYENVTMSLRPADGYHGCTSNQDLVAQQNSERHKLHIKEVELTENIAKADKEVMSLNNTLNLLANGNQEIYIGVTRITEAESEEKSALENQLSSLNSEYSQRRKMIKTMQNDIESLLEREKVITTELSDKKIEIPGKKERIHVLTSEVEDLEGKLKANQSRQRLYSKTFNTESKLAKKDAELETITQLNASVTDAFGQVMKLYPESSENIVKKFEESHLDVPTTPPSSLSKGSVLSNDQLATSLSPRVTHPQREEVVAEMSMSESPPSAEVVEKTVIVEGDDDGSARKATTTRKTTIITTSKTTKTGSKKVIKKSLWK